MTTCPDLLWPVLALCELGTVGAQRFIRWQKAAQEDLAGMAEPGLVAGCLDGRLISMDRLAAQVPEAKGIIKTRAVEHGLLPDPVTGALASYSALPARWLVDREDAAPGQEEELDLLARAILDVLSDGHREAVIKCLWIWSAVQAGTFSADTDLIGLLQPYPNNPATRAAADSAIRAVWGARHRLTADASPRSLEEAHEWARAFWDTNSMTTRCARSRETVMERCLNVLHGGHLIPSLSLNSGGNVGIARAWIDRLYELIQFSMRTLGTDGHAVVSAFAWLIGALTGPEGEAGSTSGAPPGH